MFPSGPVRWIAAPALVFCTATALPDTDAPPASRFVAGERIHRVTLNSFFYPAHRSPRWRFSARTEDEWRAIAAELRIDPDRLPPGTFDRRTVVGLVHAQCVDDLSDPVRVEVLGAVVAPGGGMTVRWRYVRIDEVLGDCAFPAVCWLDCLLWSFPRTTGRVRFRRQPTLWFDLDCR